MNFKDLLEKMTELDQVQPKDQDHFPTSQEPEEEDIGEAGQGVMAPPSEPELPEGGMSTVQHNAEEPLMGEEGVGECGGMMSPMSSMPPKQPDNVTMNVSMNGQGSGGIKDLLDILRNIEKPTMGKSADDVLVGMEEFANEPNPRTAGMGAVIPKGTDLHSKGGNEVDAVAGAGNPYSNIDESLVSHLTNLYQEIKSRS